ncbi:hypothetical protein QBC34DRAFT_391005 [Podospora aff. communis PSN243]|uniref:Uncharacterized protein n=1 Tax=Podospora aff. communis PSN243 TaxID=3040156 RepID=A0AAV9H4P0_9PEZI|nr:hypothetical protein QBC34DRAFT_391005 [Podospora aff. communis PSN243]
MTEYRRNKMADASSKAAQTLQHFWPDLAGKELQSDVYIQLLQFVKTKLKAIHENHGPEEPLSWGEWLVVVQEVVASAAKPRREIQESIRQKISAAEASDTAISRAINAAAGLWLTLDIRSPSHHLPLGSVLCWREEQSLSALVEQFFHANNTPSRKGKTATTQLNSNLTMSHLIVNYNFGIIWTHNLADHLTIDWDHKKVTVYEHKICLANHLRLQDQGVLPVDLTKEAIDTMNLLFPFDHTPTEALLRKHNVYFYGLGYYGRQRNLDVAKYPYWGSRIEELNRVLDEPPIGLHQLSLDRSQKNLLQFATFWIAAGVAVLTVITFALGVYAAIYTKKQYDLGVLQYELSLAQACEAEDAVKLPRFCS